MGGDRETVEPTSWVWSARLLTTAGVVLLPWIAYLTYRLHSRATRRSLGSSWIGLDIAEILGFLLVARMLRHRHRATSPWAAATATILAADAWFDLMSAAPRLDYIQSFLLACLGELPLAALLVWIAARTLEWAAPVDPGGQ